MDHHGSGAARRPRKARRAGIGDAGTMPARNTRKTVPAASHVFGLIVFTRGFGTNIDFEGLRSILSAQDFVPSVLRHV